MSCTVISSLKKGQIRKSVFLHWIKGDWCFLFFYINSKVKHSSYCIKECGFPDDGVAPEDEEKPISEDNNKDSTVSTMNDYCDDLDEDYNDDEDEEDKNDNSTI